MEKVSQLFGLKRAADASYDFFLTVSHVQILDIRPSADWESVENKVIPDSGLHSYDSDGLETSGISIPHSQFETAQERKKKQLRFKP